MQAIYREKYGNEDVLELRDIPIPNYGPKDVLVRIHCTTINRTDCGGLTGKPYAVRLFTGIPNPKRPVPGTDFAGVVDAIGSEVSQFKVGDRVWGFNDDGLSSQAEFMSIREDKSILKIPEGLSYSDVVCAAEGAHYALTGIKAVDLKKGDRVLVNGATGAIGSAMLQILKDKHIEVTAVCNTKNVELIASLGAAKIYNHEVEDFTQMDQNSYPVIFDSVGKSSFGACRHLLEKNGIYISTELGPSNENLYLPLLTKIKGGKRVLFPIPKNTKESLSYMTGLIERGNFTPIIDRLYSPTQIKEAYRYVASGAKTGNVLLEFSK